MCDDLTDSDLAKAQRAPIATVSRRTVGALAGAVGLVSALPSRAATGTPAVAARDLKIPMPGGLVADAHFAAPATGTYPGVLVWPDIWGLRPAFRDMGVKLAERGYAVVTINPFWRSGSAAATALDSKDEASRSKIGPMRALLTPESVASDANSFISYLDGLPQVDRKRGIGTTGYCMGGPLVMRTAAAVPGRVRAGASFHGGGLATDEPTSPHLLIPQMQASFLIAIAENDHQRRPQERDTLAAAFAAAKRPAEIEVYAGALHGWTVPDSAAWNEPAAARAFERLLALLGKSLA